MQTIVWQGFIRFILWRAQTSRRRSDVMVCRRRSDVMVCRRRSDVMVCRRRSDVMVCRRRSDVMVCRRRSDVMVCRRRSDVMVCRRRSDVMVCRRLLGLYRENASAIESEAGDSKRIAKRLRVRNILCIVTYMSPLGVNKGTLPPFEFINSFWIASEPNGGNMCSGDVSHVRHNANYIPYAQIRFDLYVRESTSLTLDCSGVFVIKNDVGVASARQSWLNWVLFKQ